MKFLRKNETLPEAIDFKTLEFPSSPNFFLLVPPGFANIMSRPESPIFDCTLDEMQAAWNRMIQTEPRVTLRSFSDAKHRYHYVQKSFLLEFPSYIIVQFIPVTDEQTTLAVYSYSVFGYNDFGTNKSRVFRWLIKFKKQLDKQL